MTNHLRAAGLIMTLCQLLFPVECQDPQSTDPPPNMLCPQGYWPTEVNPNAGPHGTDRTFKLLFTPDVDEPICRFCPNVGCFISSMPALKPKDDVTTTTTTTTSTTTSTTLPPTTTGPGGNGMFGSGMQTSGGVPEGGGVLPESVGDEAVGSTSKSDKEASPLPNHLSMSCGSLQQLPEPSKLISYLDCVQIGSPKEFYLFITMPTFVNDLPAVDCVDSEFLNWIQNGTQLLGLELGFPMKTIPPFLFLYHQRIMKSTQYVCLDSSALSNRSVNNEDMKRFASEKLAQVVFRQDGLQRNRQPPNGEGQYKREYQSNETVAKCPDIVVEKPVSPFEEDCQYSPLWIPITSDTVSGIAAMSRCPFVLPEAPNARRRQRQISQRQLRIVSVLDFALLVLVAVLTVGTVLTFCVKHRDKAVLCRARGKKRRDAEEAAAAAAAASAAEQAEAEAVAAKEAAAAGAGQTGRGPYGAGASWNTYFGRHPGGGGAPFFNPGQPPQPLQPQQQLQQQQQQQQQQNMMMMPGGGYPGGGMNNPTFFGSQGMNVSPNMQMMMNNNINNNSNNNNMMMLFAMQQQLQQQQQQQQQQLGYNNMASLGLAQPGTAGMRFGSPGMPGAGGQGGYPQQMGGAEY